jgi:DNA-binding transcriptional LysR family regulator
MELHQLRTFLAVSDAGHLTRAAERLHLSQPAVSAHIRALEDEFGARLFERTSNGMEITRPGRELLLYAQQVIAAAENLRRAAGALKGHVAGHVRIGTVFAPETLRLGAFLGRAVERHPGLEIELRQELSSAALEAVRSGALDASFYFGDLEDAEVSGIKLGEVVYEVVAPAAWTDRVRGAGWPEIAALPWVHAPAGSTLGRMAQALFAGQEAQPSRVVEADNEQVIASLVASGVGVALMRKDLARERERAGELVRWKKARASTTSWFIYRSARAADPEIAALLEVLRETWRVGDGAKASQSAGDAAAPRAQPQSR